MAITPWLPGLTDVLEVAMLRHIDDSQSGPERDSVRGLNKRRLALLAAAGIAVVLVLNVTGLIRYPGGPLHRIGPFTFTVTYHQALTVCLGPLRDGELRPVDDER